MGASKPRPAGGFRTALSVARIMLRPQYRGLVLTGAVVAAAIGGSLYSWQRWGERAMGGVEYVVTPERITITPQPTWIHTSVKAEVLRSAAAERLDLRDRKLVEHLAQAFALHPWVAKVIRVEKRYPAEVAVELQYRQPVLVVKINAPDDQGLLFLDEESVLLPSADFAPSQARDFLRISAAGETPASIYGTAWGSQRVAGAARVAAAWGKRWQPLGLYWLVASRPASGELLYELRTQDERVRVVWGVATGSESSSEPTAKEKIAALERYLHDKGPLSREGGTAVIDLRELAGNSGR
jgi:hypothetical protein